MRTIGGLIVFASVVGIAAGLIDDTFDQYVEQLMEEYHVPGLSIAIVDGDNISSQGYGYSNFPSMRATPDTLYYTASTTKAFTGAAMAMIVQNPSRFQVVNWTTPLNSIIPEFALMSDYGTMHTTVEDGLTHRSGLPSHDLAFGWGNRSSREYISSFRYLPITAEPRVEFQYCNAMVEVVGEAIAQIAGQSLAGVLRDWIWQPLGMQSTVFDLQSAHDMEGRSLARGYFWVEGDGLSPASEDDSVASGHWVPDPYYDLFSGEGVGAGEIISTVNDYSLWVQNLLSAANAIASPDEGNSSSPITAELFRDLISPRSMLSTAQAESALEIIQPQLYALGWFISSVGPYTTVEHSGGIPGFGTNVFMLPSENFGFVSMANTDGGSNDATTLMFEEAVRRKFDAQIPEHDANSISKKRDVSASHISRAKLISRKHGHDSVSLLARQDGVGGNPLGENATVALRGSQSDYTGTYFHPTYGLANISLFDQSSVTDSTDNVTYLLTFSPRASTIQAILSHSSDTFFRGPLQWVRGHFREDPVDFSDVNPDEGCPTEVNTTNAESSTCKDEVAYEYLIDTWAGFLWGQNGTVERFGVQLDPDMIDHWLRGFYGLEDSFIWFDRE